MGAQCALYGASGRCTDKEVQHISGNYRNARCQLEPIKCEKPNYICLTESLEIGVCGANLACATSPAALKEANLAPIGGEDSPIDNENEANPEEEIAVEESGESNDEEEQFSEGTELVERFGDGDNIGDENGTGNEIERDVEASASSLMISFGMFLMIGLFFI